MAEDDPFLFSDRELAALSDRQLGARVRAYISQERTGSTAPFSYRQIHARFGELFVLLENKSKEAAQAKDMVAHAQYSRLAHCFAEFRHVIGGVLDAIEKP